MKKQLLPLLLIFGLLKFSEASNLVWAKSINEINTGSASVMQISLSTDTSLLTIIGGINIDTLNVDLNGGFTNAVDPTTGSVHFALVKYDLAGKLQWYKTWSSVGDNYLNFYSMNQRASDGHIFLYGTFGTALDADPGPGVVSLTAGAYQAGFLIEVDNQGNYVWSGTLSSAGGGLYPAQVATTASGNIILTATFSSNVNIDFQSNNHVLNIGTSSDNSLIACYGTDHHLIWGGAIVGEGNNYADINSLAINTYNSDIYVSGTLYGTANFNIISGTANTTGNSTQDIFIAHYDSAGNYKGILDMGTTGLSFPDKLQYVKETGELLFNGSTGGTINLNPAGGGFVVSSPGGSIYHGFVARYDANLGYLWAATFSSNTSNTRIYYPQYDPRSGLSMIVESDTTFNANPGAGINNIVISNGDAVVLLDYYTGNYITNINYNISPGYIGHTLAYNGKIYLSGDYSNGFNAALNGSSTILNDPYGQGEYGTPFIGEYNFLEPQPGVQVSNLHFTSGTDTTVTVLFTPGNGQQRMVLVTEDSLVTDTPANGYLDFAGDTVFAMGTQFVHGAHIAYLDSGQGFTLTGIDTTGGHKYYFKAFEVNGGWVNAMSVQTANFDLENPATAVYPVPVVPTGIQQTASEVMSLYPNPTKDLITLQTNFIPSAKTVLKVLDVTGKLVQQQQVIESQKQQVNAGGLSNGIYFLQLENANGRNTIKFVKE